MTACSKTRDFAGIDDVSLVITDAVLVILEMMNKFT